METLRREKGNGPIIVPRARAKQSGLGRPVLVNRPEKGIYNQRFESFSEAAKALGISVQAVSKAINKGSPGYTLLD